MVCLSVCRRWHRAWCCRWLSIFPFLHTTGSHWLPTEKTNCMYTSRFVAKHRKLNRVIIQPDCLQCKQWLQYICMFFSTPHVDCTSWRCWRDHVRSCERQETTTSSFDLGPLTFEPNPTRTCERWTVVLDWWGRRLYVFSIWSNRWLCSIAVNNNNGINAALRESNHHYGSIQRSSSEKCPTVGYENGLFSLQLASS